MRGHIRWRTDRRISILGMELPISERLELQRRADAGLTQALPGLRPDTPDSMRRKRMLRPVQHALGGLFGNKFLQRPLGRWLREAADENTVFLECGPGDLSFRHYLPEGLVYNTVEFAVSEFNLDRVVKRDPRVNFCFGSITDLPVADNTCTVVACIEMLQQIDEIDRALSEVARVLRPGGLFLCTMSNGFSRKFEAKGKNAYFAHHWSDADFRGLLRGHGFEIHEGYQTGRWVPLPAWMTTSYSLHLPITSKDERDNCYFVYRCENTKPAARPAVAMPVGTAVMAGRENGGGTA